MAGSCHEHEGEARHGLIGAKAPRFWRRLVAAASAVWLSLWGNPRAVTDPVRELRWRRTFGWNSRQPSSCAPGASTGCSPRRSHTSMSWHRSGESMSASTARQSETRAETVEAKRGGYCPLRPGQREEMPPVAGSAQPRGVESTATLCRGVNVLRVQPQAAPYGHRGGGLPQQSAGVHARVPWAASGTLLRSHEPDAAWGGPPKTRWLGGRALEQCRM